MMSTMVWETVSRGSGPVIDEMYISVRQNSLMMNCKFYDLAGIANRQYRYVRVRRNNEEHCLLLEFFTQKQLEALRRADPLMDGFYELQPDGGAKSVKQGSRRTAIINCGTVIQKTPWLKTIANGKNLARRRYTPQRCSGHNTWMVRFIPGFQNETHVGDFDVPENVNGIYCFVSPKEEILYIGQGNICRRFAQHAAQKDIPAKYIRWTAVADKDARIAAEAHHLNIFVLRNGKLPVYNRISGHRKSKPADVLTSEISASSEEQASMGQPAEL